MSKENYDEMQLIIRYKISTHCLGIVSVLILVNGLINEEVVWASPSTQSLVIIMIPTLYFIIVTTLKGAYISNKQKNQLFTGVSLGIIGFSSFMAFVIGFNRIGIEYIFKDNMLTHSSSTIFMTVFFSIGSIINLYKFFKNGNVIDDQDDNNI